MTVERPVPMFQRVKGALVILHDGPFYKVRPVFTLTVSDLKGRLFASDDEKNFVRLQSANITSKPRMTWLAFDGVEIRDTAFGPRIVQ